MSNPDPVATRPGECMSIESDGESEPRVSYDTEDEEFDEEDEEFDEEDDEDYGEEEEEEEEDSQSSDLIGEGPEEYSDSGLLASVMVVPGDVDMDCENTSQVPAGYTIGDVLLASDADPCDVLPPARPVKRTRYI